MMQDKTGMAREDMSSVRNERFLYAAVWSVIAILPIVLELWKLINGSVFGWQSVFRWWIGMIPLILIFLIHNHFLLPRFMKKGRMRRYCLILVLVLAAYGGVQYMADKPARKDFKRGWHLPHLLSDSAKESRSLLLCRKGRRTFRPVLSPSRCCSR